MNARERRAAKRKLAAISREDPSSDQAAQAAGPAKTPAWHPGKKRRKQVLKTGLLPPDELERREKQKKAQAEARKRQAEEAASGVSSAFKHPLNSERRRANRRKKKKKAEGSSES